MKPIDFFLKPLSIAQKQYEALRSYFVDNKLASEVASKFGYSFRGFTTIVSNFCKKIRNGQAHELFFNELKRGRKITDTVKSARQMIIDLRKKYYSVEDIKVLLDSKGFKVSEKTIYNILSSEGFSRLPRRMKTIKNQLKTSLIPADKTTTLMIDTEEFKSASAGILCLLPYIEHYGISKLIEQSQYPQTKTICRLSSILCFIALKASNVRRYTADNLWCMDRGLGLFAGLNVLPKTAWYTSYSDRVTSGMNRIFLKSLHGLWLEKGLLSDTMNMDFTTIPYWGEDDHLENNWSGKRGKAMASMLAVLSHDPDSGIIDYGSTSVMHKNESNIVIEFLDFYRNNSSIKDDLKYLIFDSKFTNYQNLSKLDDRNIKFITIRRRGKNLIDQMGNYSKEGWKSIRIETGGNKKRTLKIHEDIVYLRGYNKDIRQIFITGHGRIKPAIIITNDRDIKAEQVVRKYARRWIIEKAIHEQLEFFHLNNVSSSMVIKVDFDLVMSILTHNIYRLFANDLERYTHLSVQSLYEKFIINTADVKIDEDGIQIFLKKKRTLPLILEVLDKYHGLQYNWLGNKKLIFKGASYS